MKKKNFNSLKLNKKSISNLQNNILGGAIHSSGSSVLPDDKSSYCDSWKGFDCLSEDCTHGCPE